MKDKKLAETFWTPFFPLCLGDSNSLACVKTVKEVVVEKRNEGVVQGVCWEFEKLGRGHTYALTEEFEEAYPVRRMAEEPKPFSMVTYPVKVKGDVYYDIENEMYF